MSSDSLLFTPAFLPVFELAMFFLTPFISYKIIIFCMEQMYLNSKIHSKINFLKEHLGQIYYLLSI
jgi:hypothetical protein